MQNRMIENTLKIWLLSIIFTCTAYSYTPKNGFVPDQKTAIKVAEAILAPIYGEEVLQQRPFKATLTGNRWIIEGHLPPDSLGGTAHIEIKKNTGEIVNVTHGK